MKILFEKFKNVYNFKKSKSAYLFIGLTIIAFISIFFGVGSLSSGNKKDENKIHDYLTKKENAIKEKSYENVKDDPSLSDNQKFDFSTESELYLELNPTMKGYLNNVVNNQGKKPEGIFYASGALNRYIEIDLPKLLNLENVKIGSSIQNNTIYVSGSIETDKEKIEKSINSLYDYSIAKKSTKRDLKFIYI